MIAASDPQEFVPSGRQHIQRHPGPFKPLVSVCNKNDTANRIAAKNKLDDILSNKLEKVTLRDSDNGKEWWILRKSSDIFNNSECSDTFNPHLQELKGFSQMGSSKSFFDYLNESSERRSKMNDTNVSKIKNRFSSDGENSKCTSEANERSIYNTNCTSLNKSSVFYTKTGTGCVEEELYLKGHSVVWSRGVMNTSDTSDARKKTICSYTSRSVIRCALWCNFYSERPTYNTMINITNESNEYDATKVPSICVVDNQNMKVFTERGEDFEIAVPFEVKNVWNINYGIIIEKEHEEESPDSTVEGRTFLYSLAYPLDEISPVIINHGSYLHFLNSSAAKVVFTSENPSMCVIYDSSTRQHSAYLVRKTRMEEKDFYEKSVGYSSINVNHSVKLKHRLSLFENAQATLSPINRGNSTTSSHLHSKSHSNMATISRCQSPLASTASSSQMSYLSNFHNPSSISQSLTNMSKSMLPMQQLPLICLDCFWCEPTNIGDYIDNSPATKIFICDDLAGQTYFCYIVATKLVMIKADFSNPNIFAFGPSNSISARDAVPLPHLHMLAILECNGNVSLYSGMSVIGKLHLDGTLVKHALTPCARRFHTQLNSPFPRRSSLLPNCDQGDPKFGEDIFSPVLPSVSQKRSGIFQGALHYQGAVSLVGLRDAVENRLTLQYSDNTFYRIKLPLVANSPLVQTCLNVLKQCLQRDAVMTFFTRWYSTRNSMGTQNFTNDQEWEMFTTLIYELLGYEEEHVSEMSKEDLVSPFVVAKKPKQSLVGCDDDWIFIRNSKFNRENYCAVESMLNIPPETISPHENSSHERSQINKNSVLFPYINLIHFSFHLLYEDFKLNVMKKNLLRPLAQFLNKLSNDLNMRDYSFHYWKDFPENCSVPDTCGSPTNDIRNLVFFNIGFDGVLDIMKHLSKLMKGEVVPEFPHLKNVNDRSRDIVQICGILSHTLHENYINCCTNVTSNEIKDNDKVCHTLEEVVLIMTQTNITTKVLDTLPCGLYLYFYNALWKCRENPPADWPSEAYLLIWREDLASQSIKIRKDRVEPSVDKFDIGNNNQLNDFAQPDSEYLDGMEDIDTSLTKLRFPDDVRVAETRKMLQSSKPVQVVLVQRPDISDHDFIEEQEKHLYATCTRTMALPVGRGMFTLRTATPLITKPFPTPQLCLTGKASPRGTTVELTHIDTPSNMNLWPLFHNGVANGLRVSPDASNIDNFWIVFNEPKGTDKLMEYGGFLMALGLHGHLKNLDVWNTYDYLSRKHEMVSVGILLGSASAFRGTCHTAVTKMLSIHLEALLPPTSMELEVTHAPQVTALLGVGLVYQGTAHTHMAEVLLSEIGRPPGPEMENSTDRESYSLAAGLALGLVTLQRGGKSGLPDINVSDTLHYYMTGGAKRPFTGAQKDKYKVASFQIREGAAVNLDVTSPGATLALGLMYLGTKNKTIADWMSPPETQYLLDFIRPDFLMLRIISRSLILWDDIEPSKEWVESQVPKTIRPYCMVQPSPLLDIDYEAMNQAYCNIITGACFAIGLRYAGSTDEEAFKTLLHYCHMFISLTGKSISELAGKPTIETCLNVLLLSVSMVMAGTGNLEIMRLVRHLRKRVGISSSAVVTYGSHLAIHMALGLLYLGGGRYTLSNSPSSVAALICAFYPKFPTHSNDNRYHLQAFRHLYVLAVEARLVIPRDIYLGKSCYANLKIIKLDGTELSVRAPAILPDLDTIREIAVDDERYWRIVFRKDQNWSILKKILSTNGFIEVKQRAGCLSYLVDKFGYHSQFARTLTHSKISPWNPSAASINNFTSNQSVRYFCDNFLGYDVKDPKECNLKKLLTKITYDAVITDKLIILPAFVAIRKMVEDLPLQPSSIQLWQFKLILMQVENSLHFDILSTEIVLAIKEEILDKLESWESTLLPHLRNFIQGSINSVEICLLAKLAAYVTFFELPHSFHIEKCSLLDFSYKLQSQGYSAYSVDKMLKICDISPH